MGRQVSPTPGTARKQSRNAAHRVGPVRAALKNAWQVPSQSPAAWRKDGGTGENSNMMFLRCLALRYELWFFRHDHKPCLLRGD